MCLYKLMMVDGVARLIRKCGRYLSDFIPALTRVYFFNKHNINIDCFFCFFNLPYFSTEVRCSRCKNVFPNVFFDSLEAGLLVSLCASVQKKIGVFTKCSTFYAFEMKWGWKLMCLSSALAAALLINYGYLQGSGVFTQEAIRWSCTALIVGC